MNEIEEGTRLRLDYGKLAKIAATGAQVVPVVLQHADSGEVLFIGYANELALRETLARRQAVLWSTSRNELWHKGATSGDWLDLIEVRVNCEQNSLLYRVRPRADGCCHTLGSDGRTRSVCYYRRVLDEAGALDFAPPAS
jgi:phosphoribosyl-AMP cyclohydrolase